VRTEKTGRTEKEILHLGKRSANSAVKTSAKLIIKTLSSWNVSSQNVARLYPAVSAAIVLNTRGV
jgi:hypothetical protein